MSPDWRRPALAPVLSTAPNSDVLDRDAVVKPHLRVDATDDDTLIDALIGVVTARCDGWGGILGRCLLSQQWTAYFAEFGCQRLRLPLAPVTAIAEVKYYDTANALQTLSNTTYQLLTDLVSPFVALAPTKSWPAVYCRADAIQVKFTAGYANAGTIPAPIKQAMLLMIGDLYENRESVVVGNAAQAVEIPMSTTVQALLAPYRNGSF